MPRDPAPPFGVAASRFLAKARAGEVRKRGGGVYSPETIKNYENALRVHVLDHVSDALGCRLDDVPADQLTVRVLQAMVNTVAAAASAGTARAADAAVNAVLRHLYDAGVLDEVPARRQLPAPPRPRERTVTLTEADRLLAAAVVDDERTGRSLMAPLVAVLVGVGCRVSEALGLRWGVDGVNLDRDPVTVTIGRDSTKTDAGARTVAIESEFAGVLVAHHKAVGTPIAGELVFTDGDGRRLTRDGRVRSGLRRLRDVTDVEFTAHVLRHSQGTWLADAGEGAHNIAQRLGHADKAFTLRTYVHADRGRLREPVDKLAEMRRQARRDTPPDEGGDAG